MTYDTMSVDEWLQAFFEAATEEGPAIVYDKEVTIDEIKRELRKAIIREASVGVGTVWREGRAPLEGAPEMDISCETKDGDYDLIPHKETP